MCAGMETKLADLLLEPESASVEVKTHVDGCEGCRGELEELRATMTALDAWETPEANPYWMTRFQARLEEEKGAAPAGWLERLKTRIAFGARMQVRPVAAMGFTLMLLLGGGAYLDVYWQQASTAPQPTAVVHDLQVMDNNAQLLDELENITGDQDGDTN